MKRVFYFWIFLVGIASCEAPKNTVHVVPTKDCLETMTDLSYYWRQDSLANNGFRRVTFTRLLECIPTEIPPDVVAAYLGRPDSIIVGPTGGQYRYYYYNRRNHAAYYTGPNIALYIAFIFDTEKQMLKSIIKGEDGL